MFLTVAFLVQFCLTIFRVKNERVKVYAYLIPFLKLPCDLFFGYYFSNWALAKGLNPIDSPEGTRFLSISTPTWEGIPTTGFTAGFHLQDGSTFTIADSLALWLGPLQTAFFANAFLLSLFIALSCWIVSYLRSIQKLKNILASCKFYSRSILNPILNKEIVSAKLKIGISDQIQVPCVVGLWRHTILFPSRLIHNLSQNEFEAVLAHELEHTKWYDSFIKFYLNIVNYLFWFVPKQWIKNKLELNQEYACDRYSNSRYGIDTIYLAEAIHKATYSAEKLDTSIGIAFATKQGIILRLNKLLSMHMKKESTILFWIKLLLMIVILCGLFFGKIWTF